MTILAHTSFASPTQADVKVSKSYEYFSIFGNSPEELDQSLARNGPSVSSTNMRHPGATEIQFGGELAYRENKFGCSIENVTVTLLTKIVLPRRKNGNKSDKELAIIWDTLSTDIRRHEERHSEIARSYARKLEKALKRIGPSRSCDKIEKRAAVLTERIVAEHDRAQAEFDRVQAITYQRRLIRLLAIKKAQQD